MPPKLGQVVETVLYTTDAQKLAAWYKDVLGLEEFTEFSAVVGFSLPNNTILLIFNRTMTTKDRPVEDRGMIPKHGITGTGLGQHISFACSGEEELREWEEHFASKKVEIVGRMNWERGGKSIYIKDWEGHVLEIMTRGVWSVY